MTSGTWRVTEGFVRCLRGSKVALENLQEVHIHSEILLSA